MKFLSNFYVVLFLGVFLFSACDKEETNVVTITIEEPINDEVITDCSEVHVHIDIDASVENHEVEVVLHPEGDVEDKILDIDMHEHDKEVHIEQEVDLCSYPSGTCFHLEVEACVNEDCSEKATADAEFCLE